MDIKKQKKIPIKRNVLSGRNNLNEQLSFNRKYIQSRKEKEISAKKNENSSNGGNSNNSIVINQLNRSSSQSALGYLHSHKSIFRSDSKHLLNSSEKYEEKIKSRLSKSIIVSKDIKKKDNNLSNYNSNNTNSNLNLNNSNNTSINNNTKYGSLNRKDSFLENFEEEFISPTKVTNKSSYLNQINNNSNIIKKPVKNNFLYSSVEKKSNSFLRPNLCNYDSNSNKISSEIKPNTSNYFDKMSMINSSINKDNNSSRQISNNKKMINPNNSMILGINNNGNINKINIKNGQIFKINSKFTQNIEDFQGQFKQNYASNQSNQRAINGFNLNPTNQSSLGGIKPAGISQPLPLHKISNFKYPSSAILQGKKVNKKMKNDNNQ